MASSGWKQLRGTQSTGIGMYIGPAAAVAFFNNFDWGRRPECYLLPKATEVLDAFLPLLQKLIESGPCLYVAMATLNLLEVAPQREQLPLMLSALKALLAHYPRDRKLWVDYGIGPRTCEWLGTLLRQHPSTFSAGQAVRADLDNALASLVALGLAESRQLEAALAET